MRVARERKEMPVKKKRERKETDREKRRQAVPSRSETKCAARPKKLPELFVSKRRNYYLMKNGAGEGESCGVQGEARQAQRHSRPPPAPGASATARQVQCLGFGLYVCACG